MFKKKEVLQHKRSLRAREGAEKRDWTAHLSIMPTGKFFINAKKRRSAFKQNPFSNRPGHKKGYPRYSVLGKNVSLLSRKG